jgi:hypothetical protein
MDAKPRDDEGTVERLRNQTSNPAHQKIEGRSIKTPPPHLTRPLVNIFRDFQMRIKDRQLLRIKNSNLYKTASICLTVAGFGILSGCSVATLPFKATGKVVDWSTTSQSEADRNRGRELRRDEERARDDYKRCQRDGRSDC